MSFFSVWKQLCGMRNEATSIVHSNINNQKISNKWIPVLVSTKMQNQQECWFSEDKLRRNYRGEAGMVWDDRGLWPEAGLGGLAMERNWGLCAWSSPTNARDKQCLPHTDADSDLSSRCSQEKNPGISEVLRFWGFGKNNPQAVDSLLWVPLFPNLQAKGITVQRVSPPKLFLPGAKDGKQTWGVFCWVVEWLKVASVSGTHPSHPLPWGRWGLEASLLP